MRPGAALLVIALLAAGAAGCGGSDPSALRVSAAASLKAAFTSYAAGAFPDERVDQSFAGSDLLAAQIPGAQKVVLPNVAHLPPLEVPAAFTLLVLDFLAAR